MGIVLVTVTLNFQSDNYKKRFVDSEENWYFNIRNGQGWVLSTSFQMVYIEQFQLSVQKSQNQSNPSD